MIRQIPLSDFGKPFPDDVSLFIGMVSFEDRCLSILENLQLESVQVLLLRNIGCGSIADKNLNRMIEMSRGKNTVVDLDINTPTSTADAFAKFLAPLLPSITGSVLVDTTTFTHEQLLILLRIFELLKRRCKIFMGYTGAERYSTNTDKENVWLTRGVGQIRSVLGYPGRFSPSKKLHLVVIVGFEHERVAAVIEQFEPARLTIIYGDPKKSVSSEHFETNKHFFEKVWSFVERTQSTQTAVETCYISCVDPFEAKETILKLATDNNDFNVVVCPMNTKLSTVGAGLASMQNESIQIAYAPAIEYNEEGYSSPANTARVFQYVASRTTSE